MCSGIIVKKLDVGALREVYRAHTERDFPWDERKPLSEMERMCLAGRYEALGFYRGEELLAYAYLWFDEIEDYIMLDTLAVCEGGRGKGVGSEALRLLWERYRGAYRGMYIEVEAMIPGLDEAERADRERRLRFYERAGFQYADYESRIYGVHYVVMVLGELDNAALMAAHIRHYKREFSPEIYREKIEIPYSSGKSMANS